MQAAATRGTHCRHEESVVYSCPFDTKTVSVCATNEMITYRFGPIGAPEIEIASDGHDGRSFQNTITGGGGRQTSLRFSHNGRNYVVYSAVMGSLTTTPGNHSSGTVVMQADNRFAGIYADMSFGTFTCDLDTAEQHITDIPGFVAAEVDDEFLGWW